MMNVPSDEANTQCLDFTECEEVTDARVDTILSTLDSDQVDMLRDAFIYMDRDSDGFLSEEDIMLRVKECVETPHFHELQNDLPSLFAAADQDGDGKLSLTEFLFSYAMGSGVVHAEVINRCIERVRVRLTDEQVLILQENFHRMDVDGDGFLDSNELERALRSTLSKRYPDLKTENYHQYVGSVLDSADSDHDGRLSLAEFIRSFQEDQGVLPAMYAERICTGAAGEDEDVGENLNTQQDEDSRRTKSRDGAFVQTHPNVAACEQSNERRTNVDHHTIGNAPRSREELCAIFNTLDVARRGYLCTRDLYEQLWAQLGRYTEVEDAKEKEKSKNEGSECSRDGLDGLQRRVRDVAMLLLRAVSLEQSSEAVTLLTATPVPASSNASCELVSSSSNAANTHTHTHKQSPNRQNKQQPKLSVAHVHKESRPVLSIGAFVTLFTRGLDGLMTRMHPAQEVWAHRACDTLTAIHRSGELRRRVDMQPAHPAVDAPAPPFHAEGEVVDYLALTELLATLLTPVFPSWAPTTIQAVGMAVVYGIAHLSTTASMCTVTPNVTGERGGDVEQSGSAAAPHLHPPAPAPAPAARCLDCETCIHVLRTDDVTAPRLPVRESAEALAARTPSAPRGHRSILFTPATTPRALSSPRSDDNHDNDKEEPVKECTDDAAGEVEKSAAPPSRRRPTVHASTVQLVPVVSLHRRDTVPPPPEPKQATPHSLPVLPSVRQSPFTMPSAPSSRCPQHEPAMGKQLPALTSLTSPWKRRVPTTSTDPTTVLAPLLSRHSSLTAERPVGPGAVKAKSPHLERCDCHGAGCAICAAGAMAADEAAAACQGPRRRLGGHANPLALSEEELYKLFQSYDTDKVGYLDREWFKKTYANMEQFGLEVTPSELNARFSRYARGSKKIYFNEFCVLMLQRAQM